MSLETSVERIELDLKHPFTIARGTIETVDAVCVRIGDGRYEGLGGASPAPYYGETPETVEAVLPRLLRIVEEVGNPEALDRIERRMDQILKGNPAARCAISIALHDLVAKRHDVPLYRYWGLDPTDSIETSYTIGIDDIETTRVRTAEAVDRGHGIIKLKLGTDDEAAIEAVRDVAPDVRVRVDANEAWTPKEAVEMCERLVDYDVEFVEQPVSRTDRTGLQHVYARSPLPIAVDEPCETLADIPRFADRCDIVNLKLMKCGSLREAIRMVHAARAHDLEVMLGCMTESNLSIAAGCHLAPLLDYADLDGSLLLDGDPFDGVPMPGGSIDLESCDRPGTGARPAQ